MNLPSTTEQIWAGGSSNLRREQQLAEGGGLAGCGPARGWQRTPVEARRGPGAGGRWRAGLAAGGAQAWRIPGPRAGLAGGGSPGGAAEVQAAVEEATERRRSRRRVRFFFFEGWMGCGREWEEEKERQCDGNHTHALDPNGAAPSARF